MNSHVVVVEDEPDLLALLRDLLESSGFSVTGVSQPNLVPSPESGADPALFLIDLMLPGMSGIELAAQLREQGYSSTPMIAMSASRLMLEIASSSNLFDRMLPKPFDVSMLLDCVEAHIGQTSKNYHLY